MKKSSAFIRHRHNTGLATASRYVRCFPMKASASTPARFCCSIMPARRISARRPNRVVSASIRTAALKP